MNEFETIKDKKFPYRITKSNWILFIVTCIVSIILNTKVISSIPELIGYMIGIATAYFLMALLFGLIFWFILGKKENGGSTTFNVVVIIVLLGQLGQFGNSLSSSNVDSSDLNSALKEYKQALQNDSIGSVEAYQDLTKAFDSNIDKYIQESKGNEKDVFISLKEFFNEAKEEANQWMEAYSKVSDESFFNFSVLNDKKEIDNQIHLAEEYIKATKKYKSFFLGRKDRLNQIVENNEVDSELIDNIIIGFSKKESQQKPVFIPYLDYNIEHVNIMMGVMQLCKNNDWKFSEDTNSVEFQDESIQNKFDDYINELVEIETKINELYEQLVIVA